MVICYMRVSSPQRNGRSRQTTDSQKLALKRFCKLQGIKRPQWIEDFATGRNQNRQGFQDVLTACRDGSCKRLIVWKLDRLGRSAVETITTIRTLMEQGIRIDITTQGLSFDQSPFSTFLIQLFASLAELESNHASERIRAGLAVAKSKGKRLGRKPNDKRRSQIQRWRSKGMKVAVIAERLGKSRQAVYSMLSRMS